VKVRYREGLAIHPDPSGGVVAEEELTIPPESCAGVRKGTGEASTGADVSPVCVPVQAGDRSPFQSSDGSPSSN